MAESLAVRNSWLVSSARPIAAFVKATLAHRHRILAESAVPPFHFYRPAELLPCHVSQFHTAIHISERLNYGQKEIPGNQQKPSRP